MSTNSRQAGKRWERYFKNKLKEFFPDIQRNAAEQAARGGVDLINTKHFDFEVKGGKQCNIKKTRDWLDQCESEGEPTHNKVVLVKPLREEPFVMMPYSTFEELLHNLKSNDII